MEAPPTSLAQRWCDPDPWLYGFLCAEFVEAPIWCIVFVADCVALWLIVNVLIRQRLQSRKVSQKYRAWLQLPLRTRARRLWQRLGATVQNASLASVAAAASARNDMSHAVDIGNTVGGTRNESQPWHKSWQKVTKAIKDRRTYLSKRDFDLVSVFGRAVGPMFCLVSCVLITFEVHVFYYLALPWWRLSGLRLLGVNIFSIFVTSRLFFDYARTTLTDPGSPAVATLPPPSAELTASTRAAPDAAAGKEEVAEELSDVIVDAELGFQKHPVHQRLCGPCGGVKPARCHHCRVCRRCVLKMDHHCPFVNNCVGLRNHRYFCYFLLDLVVGLIVLSLCLLPQIVETAVWKRDEIAWARQVHMFVAFAISTFFTFLLTPFFLFHMYLVVVDATTLENMKRQRPSRRRAGAGPGAGGANGHGDGAGGEAHSTSNQEDAPRRRLRIERLETIFGSPPVCCRRRLKALLLSIAPMSVASVLAKRNA